MDGSASSIPSATSTADFLGCQPLQITGETVGEVRAVAGMHQRKAEMARNSDAFIALPGKQPAATAYASVTCLLELDRCPKQSA
jgi:hypothetical protein